MKFSFSTLACPSWSLEDVAENAVRMGYTGVELRLLDGEVINADLLRTQRARLLQLFQPPTLPLVAVGTSARFISPVLDERRANEEEVANVIQIARDLTVPLVRVFGGQLAPGQSVDEATTLLAASLNRLAPIAEAAGIRIGLETHDDFSASARIAAVLSLVPSPAVGALWDTLHPFRAGDGLPEVWTRLAGRLIHVHVKDAHREPDGAWKPALLGEGDVPVREIVRALAMRDYTGFISVEWEKKWYPEIEEPEVALPQHIAKLWEWTADV